MQKYDRKYFILYLILIAVFSFLEASYNPGYAKKFEVAETYATKDAPTFTGDVTMPGSGKWLSNGNVGIGVVPSVALDVNGNIVSNGTITGTNLNVSNWDTAYGWGNHGAQGYLKSSNFLRDLTTGGGLTGGANNILYGSDVDIQISHSDTSSAGSVNNSNAFVIQDIILKTSAQLR
ncbi:MAG: hypothetical protein GY817_09270 [bacterium]|nr:hypothetical protein [bacterium]